MGKPLDLQRIGRGRTGGGRRARRWQREDVTTSGRTKVRMAPARLPLGPFRIGATPAPEEGALHDATVDHGRSISLAIQSPEPGDSPGASSPHPLFCCASPSWTNRHG